MELLVIILFAIILFGSMWILKGISSKWSLGISIIASLALLIMALTEKEAEMHWRILLSAIAVTGIISAVIKFRNKSEGE